MVCIQRLYYPDISLIDSRTIVKMGHIGGECPVQDKLATAAVIGEVCMYVPLAPQWLDRLIVGDVVIYLFPSYICNVPLFTLAIK
jgi:hypothetical protein